MDKDSEGCCDSDKDAIRTSRLMTKEGVKQAAGGINHTWRVSSQRRDREWGANGAYGWQTFRVAMTEGGQGAYVTKFVA